MGDNGLDQVRGHFVHTLAAARGTKAALLTRKCNEPFCLTLLAAQPREPMSQYSAAKVSLDLLMNMTWKGLPLFRVAATKPQKGLEIFRHRAIQNRLLRLVAEIVSCRNR